VLREKPTVHAIVGMVVILAGVALARHGVAFHTRMIADNR